MQFHLDVRFKLTCTVGYLQSMELRDLFELCHSYDGVAILAILNR